MEAVTRRMVLEELQAGRSSGIDRREALRCRASGHTFVELDQEKADSGGALVPARFVLESVISSRRANRVVDPPGLPRGRMIGNAEQVVADADRFIAIPRIAETSVKAEEGVTYGSGAGLKACLIHRAVLDVRPRRT